MCDFFSFVSDQSKKKFYYFNWKQRQELLKNNPKDYNPDSHSSIASFFGYSAKEEDQLNKYEYNPLTRKFVVDQINSEIDDSVQAEEWVNALDFKSVVEPLILKPIVNSFDLPKVETVTEDDIENLKQWISVMDSVTDSVWISVRNSLGIPIGDSVWTSAGDLIGDSIKKSIRSSFHDSVSNSVWDSVWDSIYAYISSFFNIKYEHDFSCLNALWNKGLLPSFDGTTWRLHSGKKAEVVYEMKVN
jgi:hypothetical protein